MKTEEQSMPFEVKDCALIARMAGIGTAMNLRELQERIGICPVECLFHHFCETVIRPTFDDPEFRNDFAVWAARQLRDKILAERLAIINPYKLGSFEELRLTVLDILEERLSEVAYIPWAQRGREFNFMQAVTVVFDTGLTLAEPRDLLEALPHMSLGSVYYHFVEARRRTDGQLDDFSAWMKEFATDTASVREALAGVDFYFLNLSELKRTLIQTLGKVMRGRG